jgi:ABC-type branched-subunit amino acid transport system substrate-binding protein
VVRDERQFSRKNVTLKTSLMIMKAYLKILKRTILQILVAVLCSLMLFGCGTISGFSSRDLTIKPQTERPPVPANVRNVALLLPLNGTLAVTGKAIRNGFLAAYYNHQEKNANTTAPAVNIKVTDTSGKNILEVYKKVVASGVDVIVGPLTKQEVDALAAMGNALPVPTIALNTLSNYQRHPVANLYQFGLLPQDEAQQVATKMFQDGHQQIGVLMPENQRGQSIFNVFKSEFARQGGKIIATVDYSAQDDLDLKIQQFLQMNYDEIRHKAAVKSYRRDISAIFLITETTNAARQIVPLVRFYTNGKLSMYAISSIYSGFARPEVEQDLNKVTFCDMPWTIDNGASLDPALQEIRGKISGLFPDALKNNTRLYALGVDAYNVAVSLNKLINEPSVGFNGATGRLFLDGYNHIYRQLQWTTMKQSGQPLAMSEAATAAVNNADDASAATTAADEVVAAAAAPADADALATPLQPTQRATSATTSSKPSESATPPVAAQPAPPARANGVGAGVGGSSGIGAGASAIPSALDDL